MLVLVTTMGGDKELVNTDHIVRVIPVYGEDRCEWSKIITLKGEVETIRTVTEFYDKIKTP